jgi:NAD-dependent SIR2 family protein deacetylase
MKSWAERLRDWIDKGRVVPLCRSCWRKRVKKSTLYYLGTKDFEKCADCGKRVRRDDVVWVDS